MINDPSWHGRGWLALSNSKPSPKVVGLIVQVTIPKVPSARQRVPCSPASSRCWANPVHSAGQEEDRRVVSSASPRGLTSQQHIPALVSPAPPLHSNTRWSERLPQSTQGRQFSVEGRDSKSAQKSQRTFTLYVAFI